MDSELLNKGEFKIKLEEGNLVLMFDSKGVDVSVKLETDYFLEKLKEAIPGEIDDKVIELIKIAMKVG